MRSSFTATTGLRLTRSPNARDQAARWRLVAAAAFIGLALAGGLLGAITAPSAGDQTARTGPFSYFPSE
ncbi:MAG: hypothetical protein EPO51_07105 [Phenylobacterium sp.]|uniref:hypothetical protein n=1 Tax=Phenylobacterium sp. TaxID=1871053 RepID=UPI0012080069|nr:hypothetical protein [Phenylobacterium sp.]TAJ72895.1 MAG: hypothetical protein EPO51_07105 [Phenylobacterium sp.]